MNLLVKIKLLQLLQHVGRSVGLSERDSRRKRTRTATLACKYPERRSVDARQVEECRMMTLNPHRKRATTSRGATAGRQAGRQAGRAGVCFVWRIKGKVDALDDNLPS